MSKEELKSILDTENNRPDEMATEWYTVSYAAAQRAMVAAYNKGIEDAVNEVAWIDADILRERIEQLKIKD
jgi:hypothetical protein